MRALLLAAVVALAVSVPASPAATIVVNEAADELNADGDCSLREAVRAANGNTTADECIPGTGADTISLPSGFYAFSAMLDGDDDGAQTGDLDLAGNLAIVGAGATSTQVDARGLDRVFDVLTGATVRLSGLAITGGLTPSPNFEDPNSFGGGIETGGTLTLDRVLVSGNKANGCGGGLASAIEDVTSNGPITIRNSTLSNNTADCGGGAWYASNRGPLMLRSVLVANNSAPDSSGGGGGIYDIFDLDAANTVFVGNTTAGQGGGLLTGRSLRLVDVRIEGNTAAQGGGLYQGNFVVLTGGVTRTLNRVVVSGNRAEGGDGLNLGGGIVTGGNAFTLMNSTVSGNTAGAGGGGVYAPFGATIAGTTISGNKAENGDGLYNAGGGSEHDPGTVVRNATISGNGSVATGGRGGGIYNASVKALTLNNVTLNANTSSSNAGDGGNIYNAGIINAKNTVAANPQTGGNCGGVRPASTGPNLEWVPGGTSSPCFTALTDVVADPMLDPLASNGGPTNTQALRAGSAAINAGAECAPADQRGVPRPQGAACDIGAYEFATCFSARVNVVGTPAGNVIRGTAGDDVVFALGGNDLVDGRGGSDRICAGDGNDVVIGAAGDDRLGGGPGIDFASFPGTLAVVASLAGGVASGRGSDVLVAIENLRGSSAGDRLTGNGLANRLEGLAGNDRLDGRTGNDTCAGGAGAADTAVNCEVKTGIP